MVIYDSGLVIYDSGSVIYEDAGVGCGRDGLPAAPILAYLGSGAPDSQNTQIRHQLHFMIGILVQIQNAPVLNGF